MFSLRIFLGLIFLTSGYGKNKNLNLHKYKIEGYGFFPKNLVNFIAIFDVILEIFIGVSFIFGILINQFLLVAISLFFIYAIAAVISLSKEQEKVSCGCGGILGDKEASWLVIIRNCFFIGICFVLLIRENLLGNIDLFLTNQHPIDQIYNFNYIYFFCFSLISTFIYQTTSNLLNMYKTIRLFRGGI